MPGPPRVPRHGLATNGVAGGGGGGAARRRRVRPGGGSGAEGGRRGSGAGAGGAAAAPPPPVRDAPEARDTYSGALPGAVSCSRVVPRLTPGVLWRPSWGTPGPPGHALRSLSGETSGG